MKQTAETVATQVHELVVNLAERVLPSDGPMSMASLSANFDAIDSAMSQLFDELETLGDNATLSMSGT